MQLLSNLFFFNDTATTEIYTLSLHDALPILPRAQDPEPSEAAALGFPSDDPADVEPGDGGFGQPRDRKRSEEHTSELQSQSNLVCRLLLEKKKKIKINNTDVNEKS